MVSFFYFLLHSIPNKKPVKQPKRTKRQRVSYKIRVTVALYFPLSKGLDCDGSLSDRKGTERKHSPIINSAVPSVTY